MKSDSDSENLSEDSIITKVSQVKEFIELKKPMKKLKS